VLGGIEAATEYVWAPRSLDEELGMVFLPTSSPSPDFWGSKRPRNNEHANLVGCRPAGGPINQVLYADASRVAYNVRVIPAQVDRANRDFHR
jgi:hypothetical protein